MGFIRRRTPYANFAATGNILFHGRSSIANRNGHADSYSNIHVDSNSKSHGKPTSNAHTETYIYARIRDLRSIGHFIYSGHGVPSNRASATTDTGATDVSATNQPTNHL